MRPCAIREAGRSAFLAFEWGRGMSRVCDADIFAKCAGHGANISERGGASWDGRRRYPTPSVPATVGTVAGHTVQNGFEGSWNEESRNAGPIVLGRTVPNAVTGVVGLLALSQRPNRCRDAPSFGQRSIVCRAAPSWQRLASRQRPRVVVGTLGCRATATSVVATHRSGTPGPVGGTAPPPIGIYLF